MQPVLVFVPLTVGTVKEGVAMTGMIAFDMLGEFSRDRNCPKDE